jgi:hypothetical protein
MRGEYINFAKVLRPFLESFLFVGQFGTAYRIQNLMFTPFTNNTLNQLQRGELNGIAYGGLSVPQQEYVVTGAKIENNVQANFLLAFTVQFVDEFSNEDAQMMVSSFEQWIQEENAYFRLDFKSKRNPLFPAVGDDPENTVIISSGGTMSYFRGESEQPPNYAVYQTNLQIRYTKIYQRDDV